LVIYANAAPPLALRHRAFDVSIALIPPWPLR
jgi:hypothetical protein